MDTTLLKPPRPREGDHLRWGGLVPGADALALASAACAHGGTLVVLTATSAAAERLEHDLRFFLGSSREAKPVLRLPDWETLPYDRFSPHQDLVSDRLLALSRLAQGDPLVLIVPVATLMQRTAPVAYVSASSLVLDPGQRLGVARLRETLARAGYRAVENVYEHGEFAVRGSIVDLFPMGHDTPVCIELFDDEIETLRSFDPDTQRSLAPLERLRLLPGREYPFDEAAIAASAAAGTSISTTTTAPAPTTRKSRAAPRPEASSTSCRSSSTPAPRCSITCPGTACSASRMRRAQRSTTPGRP